MPTRTYSFTINRHSGYTNSAALRRLTTTATRSDTRVHLLNLMDPRDTGETLCHRNSATERPTSDLWSHACADCLATALAGGFTVVRQGNAYINLKRVPQAVAEPAVRRPAA